jgi:DNA polymerase-3 subunit chi
MPANIQAYQRLVVLFDGEDEEAVTAARACWKDVTAKGFDATYWQPDQAGRWTKKA